MRFLSLKWKVVLTLSALLLSVVVVLVAFGYSSLENQFKSFQKSSLDAQSSELRELIQDRFDNLQQNAQLLIFGHHQSRHSFQDHLTELLTEHGSLLEFSSTLESILLYQESGEVLYEWNGKTSTELQSMAKNAAALEQPVNTIICEAACLQWSAVPVLRRDSPDLVLILSRSIADVILAFNAISGADAALMVFSNDKAPNSKRYIANWKAELPIVTNSNRVFDIIVESSNDKHWSDLVNASYLFNEKDSFYDISVIPFQENVNSQASFIVVRNVTSFVQNMERSWWLNMTFGVASIIAIASALLILLWTPIQRMKMFAENLPLLAQGAFEEARILFKVNSNQRYLDELDTVANTASSLSTDLEQLTQEVEIKTGQLEKRNQQLVNERDFITRLLDTANVLIITQDKQGRITRLNREASELTGYTPSPDTPPVLFNDIFGSSDEITMQLAQMQAGILNHCRHDSSVSGDTGKQYRISWIHSLLDRQQSDESHILSIGMDITEREKAQKRIGWLADHDHLTGLFNRRRFQEEFRQELAGVKRYDRRGALLFFDLDDFKLVNDTSGHQIGDELLKRIADEMKQLLRTTDLLARLGGDEFALVLPEADEEDAVHIAQKLHQRISQISISHLDHVHRASVSIGIAFFPKHGVDLLDLMACADLAMYRAKQLPNQGWHIYQEDDGSRKQLHELYRWKERIEAAIEEDRFILHYQPIVKIGESRTSHFEVLLRMIEPDGSLVYPDNIIPVAEQHGLISTLDQLVIKQSIQRLSEVVADHPETHLAINISGRNMGDTFLVDQIKELLEQYPQVKPQNLTFELTETAAVADLDRAIHLIHAIRYLGCHFAIDDFGTGFSSFYYLKKMPADIVKIDGSYISQIERNEEDRILVRALADMANALGKQVVAEYVESKEILDLLKSFNIQYVQGHYLGHPVAQLPLLRVASDRGMILKS